MEKSIDRETNEKFNQILSKLKKIMEMLDDLRMLYAEWNRFAESSKRLTFYRNRSKVT